MARNKAPERQAGGSAADASRGKSKNTTTAAGSAATGAENHEAVLPDWEEVPEDPGMIPDIDGLTSAPAAIQDNDPEARRRIEKLREDRLLQQVLSDVFDL
jgi:hypothetical protein